MKEILEREWEASNALCPCRNEYMEELGLEQLKKSEKESLSQEEIVEILYSFYYIHICEETIKNFMFLRKNTKEIIGKGNGQIVVKLQNGYVMKVRFKQELSDYYAVGSFPDSCVERMAETIANLSKLGFDTPDYIFKTIKKPEFDVFKDEGEDNEFFIEDKFDDSKNDAIIITRDLTEGGKFKLEEVTDKNLAELENSAEVRKELEKALTVLNDIYNRKNREYLMQIKRHLTSEGAQDAFKHMFFIQIDQNTNKGKLVLGDLDHIEILIDSSHLNSGITEIKD